MKVVAGGLTLPQSARNWLIKASCLFSLVCLANVALRKDTGHCMFKAGSDFKVFALCPASVPFTLFISLSLSLSLSLSSVPPSLLGFTWS